MKKLFALLVVLALCGAANAASVTLDGAGTIILAEAGAEVTITLSGTGMAGMDALITISGDVTITGYMDASDCAAYGWDPLYSPPIAMLETPTSVELGGALGSGFNNGPTVGYVTVLYGGSGTATVSLAPGFSWGGSNPVNPTEGSLNIELIPEPMTIALLGLGGLFIRRRK